MSILYAGIPASSDDFIFDVSAAVGGVDAADVFRAESASFDGSAPAPAPHASLALPRAAHASTPREDDPNSYFAWLGAARRTLSEREEASRASERETAVRRCSDSSGTTPPRIGGVLATADFLTDVLEFADLVDLFAARQVCAAWWKYAHELIFTHKRFAIPYALNGFRSISAADGRDSQRPSVPADDVPWLLVALAMSLEKCLAPCGYRVRIFVSVTDMAFGMPRKSGALAPALANIVESVVKGQVPLEHSMRCRDAAEREAFLIRSLETLRAVRYALLLCLNRDAYRDFIDAQRDVTWASGDANDATTADGDDGDAALPKLSRRLRHAMGGRITLGFNVRGGSALTSEELKKCVRFFVPFRHAFAFQCFDSEAIAVALPPSQYL